MALTHPDVDWQYLEGHRWRSMGAAIGNLIEAAFVAGNAEARYAAGPGTYTLSFAEMTQENDATHFARPVRRELSAAAAARVPPASAWECKADAGWISFPPEHADFLTRAAQRNRAQVVTYRRVHGEWWRYVVDLRPGSLAQTNFVTNARRQIRPARIVRAYIMM